MNITYKRVLFLILPIILFNSNNVWAYTMPTGILETDIDFENEGPERPSNWNEEIPGYYYIDMVAGSNKASYGSEVS